MASKGPKTGTATPVGKLPINAPAKQLAGAPKGTPAIVAKPVKAAQRVVIPQANPAPVAPAPTPLALSQEPVVAAPVIAAPIVAAPAPVSAAPVSAPVAAAPVISPQAPAAAPASAPIEPAAAPAAALIKKESIMDTIHTATETSQAQANAMFADVNVRAKSAMEKGSKMLEDMNAFSKGNIEAVVESSKIAAKGAEEVARYTTDYARAAVEKANAAAKQFAAVKSPTELFKLQGDLAKDAMDQMMAETAKFTENYLKLLGEIAQPLSNRVAVAAEKMKIAA